MLLFCGLSFRSPIVPYPNNLCPHFMHKSGFGQPYTCSNLLGNSRIINGNFSPVVGASDRGILPPLEGAVQWRLISHLALDHLRLCVHNKSVEPLRELLRLYSFIETHPASEMTYIVSGGALNSTNSTQPWHVAGPKRLWRILQFTTRWAAFTMRPGEDWFRNFPSS